MSAYATNRNPLYALPNFSTKATEASAVEMLVAQLADRVAAMVVDRLGSADKASAADEWFDSRHAAEYLGVHRDTLRKLAAERAIPSEQDGPGCKLYFRRSELDAWRQAGGRPRHLVSAIGRAA
jgi:excisionase family DNA binding protein